MLIDFLYQRKKQLLEEKKNLESAAQDITDKIQKIRSEKEEDSEHVFEPRGHIKNIDSENKNTEEDANQTHVLNQKEIELSTYRESLKLREINRQIQYVIDKINSIQADIDKIQEDIKYHSEMEEDNSFEYMTEEKEEELLKYAESLGDTADSSKTEEIQDSPKELNDGNIITKDYLKEVLQDVDQIINNFTSNRNFAKKKLKDLKKRIEDTIG